jgi:hypothetical protein
VVFQELCVWANEGESLPVHGGRNAKAKVYVMPKSCVSILCIRVLS